MRKSHLLFIFILFLFATCKKDPEPTKPAGVSYTSQDLTAYSFFKTGTYWIYKDSATAVEDSVYVNADTSYSYHQTGTTQADGDYMFYNFHAHSFYDTYDYYYHISTGYYILTTKEIGVQRIRINASSYVGETYLMSNRFVNGDVMTWYLGTGSTYYKEFYNDFTVLGTNYQSVVKFYDSKNASEYESPTNFYIAKNIGIIKKEKLDSNKTWNLIRYNIVQ